MNPTPQTITAERCARERAANAAWERLTLGQKENLLRAKPYFAKASDALHDLAKTLREARNALQHHSNNNPTGRVVQTHEVFDMLLELRQLTATAHVAVQQAHKRLGRCHEGYHPERKKTEV